MYSTGCFPKTKAAANSRGLYGTLKGRRLLGLPEVLVVHRDVVLPLLRDIVLGENCGYWASRFARAAIDAFGWIDVEHRRRFKFRLIFFWMNAVHGTGIHTSGVLRADARLTNDVGHRG